MVRMADVIHHIEDIGKRLQEGKLDPKEAGDTLQYLAKRLRKSCLIRETNNE